MKRHWKRGKMEERKNNWERKEKDLGEKKKGIYSNKVDGGVNKKN